MTILGGSEGKQWLHIREFGKFWMLQRNYLLNLYC